MMFGRVTKVNVLFLVLVSAFHFKFSAAILEKGLLVSRSESQRENVQQYQSVIQLGCYPVSQSVLISLTVYLHDAYFYQFYPDL